MQSFWLLQPQCCEDITSTMTDVAVAGAGKLPL